MQRLQNLVLVSFVVVACLASSGCSTVGSAGKYIANQAGVYDYPVEFKSTQGVYARQSWEALYGVKPDAQAKVGQIIDLAKVHSLPRDVENNLVRTMYLVDEDHDLVITVAEAEKGAKNAVQLVNDALGDLKISDGTATVKRK